jgi:hypothetical protein
VTYGNVRVRFCAHCKKKTKQLEENGRFVCRRCLKETEGDTATDVVNDASLRVAVREEKGSRRLNGFPTFSVYIASAEDDEASADGFFFVTKEQPEDAAKAIARGMELLIATPEGRKMLGWYYEREYGKEVAVAQ